ncbi:hypothetical protein D3C84_1122890 [compost metagenome]
MPSVSTMAEPTRVSAEPSAGSNLTYSSTVRPAPALPLTVSVVSSVKSPFCRKPC